MAPDLRERIAKDVLAVVAEPEITKRLVATGQTVRTGGPADLARTLVRAGRPGGDRGEDAGAQGRQVVRLLPVIVPTWIMARAVDPAIRRHDMVMLPAHDPWPPGHGFATGAGFCAHPVAEAIDPNASTIEPRRRPQSHQACR